ncbi:hypothetical protein BCR44DRAFT_1053442 [Catenaria anguillulae PL171]|uniref:Uncharacterized protein n=1 Tax=Catenaria anguillulae PL171 TaxID=765915 RepID=A0A1Y2HRC3_9FUNG|nr:hypothetical protein BCR44DRAFT_1053442 [Catenaria anguillulae PL171]
MSWPYLTSLTLHFNYIVITIVARTILRKSPLGFVVELGHFCTTIDWFVFFTKTDPMVQDVEVTEVTIPNKRGGTSEGSNVSQSNITVYTKQYRPPTAHLPGLLSPTSTGFPQESSSGSASAYGSSPPSTLPPGYASPSPPTSRSGTPANGSSSRKAIRPPSHAALALSPIATSRSPSRTPPLTTGQIHDAHILSPQSALNSQRQQQYMQHYSHVRDPSPTVLDSARYRDVHEYANAYGSHLHPSPPHSRSASPSNHHQGQSDRRPSHDYIPALQIATMRLPSESGISNGDQISNEPSWNPNDVAARASGSTYTAFAYSAAPATTSTVSGPTVSNPNGAGSSSSSQGRQFLGRNPAAPTTSTARGQLDGPTTTHAHGEAWAAARSLSPSSDPRSVGMSPPVSPRPEHEDTVDDRWRRARDEWAFTAAVEHQQREQQRVLEAYRERQRVQQHRYREEVEIEVNQQAQMQQGRYRR